MLFVPQAILLPLSQTWTGKASACPPVQGFNRLSPHSLTLAHLCPPPTTHRVSANTVQYVPPSLAAPTGTWACAQRSGSASPHSPPDVVTTAVRGLEHVNVHIRPAHPSHHRPALPPPAPHHEWVPAQHMACHGMLQAPHLSPCFTCCVEVSATCATTYPTSCGCTASAHDHDLWHAGLHSDQGGHRQPARWVPVGTSPINWSGLAPPAVLNECCRGRQCPA